jgi:mannitol/fructose-specific phosphotransferase system IIA component (Ntr-type)/CBS domain-containing protein
METEKILLTDRIAEGNILCNVEAMQQTQIIERLVDLLARHIGGFDRDNALKEIIARETLSPTTIAPGLALPHARLEGLSTPLIALGISPEGFQFGEDEEPVHIVVLLLASKSDPGAYLRLLSAVSKTLCDESLRQRLTCCSSPAEVHSLLQEGGNQLPSLLRAIDMRDRHPVTLREEDTLAAVIDTLCRQSILDIPIVDADGDIRGVISQEDLLRLSLPEHLLWMEDLTPILNFQPFADILRKDQETKVADFMREEYLSIAPDTPAIQLAKMFQTSGVRQIVVLDGKRFLGVVNLQSFIAQLFWM